MQSVSKRTRSKFKQTSLTNIDVPKNTRLKERVDCATQTDQRRQLASNNRTRGKREQRSSGSMLENEGMQAPQQPETSASLAEGDQKVDSPADHNEDTHKIPDESYAPAGKSVEVIETKPDGAAAGRVSAEGGQSVSPVDDDHKYEDKKEKSKRTLSKFKQTSSTNIDVPKKTRWKERVDCATQTDQRRQLASNNRTRGKREQRSSGSMLENEGMQAPQQPETSAYLAEGDQRVSPADHDEDTHKFPEESYAPAGKSDEVIETKPGDGAAAGRASAEGVQSVSPVDDDHEYEDKKEKCPDVLHTSGDKLIKTHGDGAADEGSASSAKGDQCVSSVDDDREPHIKECSSPRDGTSALKQKDSMASNFRNAVSAKDATAAATPDNAASPLVEAATPDENAKLPSSFDAAAITPVSPMVEKGSVVTELPAVSKVPFLGQRVVVSGRHAKPEINGRVGLAKSFDGARGIEDGGDSFKIRPDSLVSAPPRSETDGLRAAAPDKEARFRGSFDTSSIDTTQFAIVSTRTFVEIQQRMKNNTDIIRKAAKERETLMALIQGKTRENAMLSSLMIELSDKQTLRSEELAREYASMNKELEKARNMKREMVRMYARIMGEDNLDYDVPKKLCAKMAASRRDAESCTEGASSLSEAAARLNSDAMDQFNEHVDCATGTSIQLTATSTNIAPKPLSEVVSGSAHVAEVGEAASSIIAPEPFGEAVSDFADVAEVCEPPSTNIAPEQYGQAVSGSADVAEVGETAVTIIAPQPFGEAMSSSADMDEVGEAVAGSSDVAEVGEAMAGPNASLLYLLTPFLSLLADVGEAVAGR
jgi:hypothetical protein